MQKGKVYFRTDASSEIGMGHFSRCMGLADIVKDFLEPVFIMQQFSAACQRLCAEKKYDFYSLQVHDNQGDEIDIIDEIVIDQSIVVLDGYHLTGGWMPLFLRKKGCMVVCIDDIHAHHFYSDVVINHGGATEKDYSIEPYTRLYLGLDYALLKREFIEATKMRAKRSSVKNILVAMGGTDPKGYSLQLAQWFSDLEEFEQINFLTTSANKDLIKLVDFCNMYDHLNVHIDLSTAEVIWLFQENDLAILPASTLCIEACAVGIGVVCGITADNQKDMYAGLTSIPAVKGVEYLMNNSDQKIKSLLRSIKVSDVNNMIDYQIKLIDGKSHSRIQTIFKGLC